MNNRRAFLKIASISIGSDRPILLIHSAHIHVPLGIHSHEAKVVDSTDAIFALNRSFDIESVAVAEARHLVTLFKAIHVLDKQLFELPLQIDPLTIVIEPAYAFNEEDFVQRIIKDAEQRSRETLHFFEPLLACERAWHIPLSVPLRTRNRNIQLNYSRYARSRL